MICICQVQRRAGADERLPAPRGSPRCRVGGLCGCAAERARGGPSEYILTIKSWRPAL